jgi:hypothetical protein
MAEMNTTQMRDALAWATNDQRPEEETPTNPWEWFWQAVQGDFNENRSTGQIVVDAAISIVPLVDQICDVRDLIANCKKLREQPSDKWAWIALVLTLIGLFPFLGSLVKGCLKVFFAFVRRAGGGALERAVEGAMTWVITLLRREAFQKYLRLHKIDDVFAWLAKEIQEVRNKVKVAELLKAFDTAIKTLEAMVKKVEMIPGVGPRAKSAYDTVVWVRSRAKEGMAEVTTTIDAVFEAIVRRLEHQALMSRHGIVNVNNIHYRGHLPEAAAVTLMRKTRPRPSWLNDGMSLRWPEADPMNFQSHITTNVKNGWPVLTDQNIKSFHHLAAAEIKGPARLYRILSPNSRAMSDCWISEEVFKAIQNSPDPRAAWRKYLAVWPDWNVNGQFVIYDVKPGETLKAWRGPASSQKKDVLLDCHLEGGWEQIVFNVARTDLKNDVMRYYKRKGGKKNILQDAISQAEFDKLGKAQRDEYTPIRESINHPNISGPFETGWGYTDFEGQGLPDKIGLPALPGQVTALQM